MNLFNVYETNLDLEKIENLFRDGDIDEQEYTDTKESFQLMLQDHKTDVMNYTKNLDIMIKALDTESKRLIELKKSTENKKTKLLLEIQDYMNRKNIKEVDCGINKFKIQKNRSSVNIIDPKKIPSRFITIVQDEKISKVDISKAIKNGEIIDGAELISKETVKIK